MKNFKPVLKYVRVGMSCCGDDWVQTESSRYDLERLGCIPALGGEDANLLVIQGNLNEKLKSEVIQKMPEVPVTIYVTGCPPRPEAIMNGILSLREAQT
jgi:NADH-quinone oxidoreductase subunit B